MFKNLLNKSKVQKGFTIIEVMIVLAIAGLILVVVLIAIPQLQRNQRNQARSSVASRIVTEINNYAGNNNGDYPEENLTAGTKHFANPTLATGFFGRYLGCADADPGDCTSNINDPRTGDAVGTGDDGGVPLETTLITAAGQEPADQAGSIAYGLGYICDGEDVIDGANRNFVFLMRLEGGSAGGGAILCLDNK